MPAATAFIHVDLTGYPHTACIHLIACSVDGRSYTLFACRRKSRCRLDPLLGCHCPRCWVSGIRYRPCSSRLPIRIGSPLHVISTSSSLCTVTPSLVKIDIVPSSDVCPTLINDVGNCSNVSACLALADSCGNGNAVTFFALTTSPFATCTFLLD